MAKKPKKETSRPITVDELRLHEIVESANGRSKVKLAISTWVAIIGLGLAISGSAAGLLWTTFQSQTQDAKTMGTHETSGHANRFRQVDKNETKIDKVMHNIYQIGKSVGAKDLKPMSTP